jgi:mRNA interferase MazF
MSVRRGEVVLIDYPYTTSGSKVRPALVVQNDRDNQRLPNTMVAQITSNVQRALTEPTQYLIDLGRPEGQQSGLRRTSAVNCVNLFTIDQRDILHTLGNLPAPTMAKIDDCLKAALGLP